MARWLHLQGYFAAAVVLLCLLVLLQAENVRADDAEEDDTSAEEYLQRGDDALKARIYDRATENYSKAIEKDPENYLGFYKRALTFIQRGRSKSAIKDFTSVLSLKSDHVASLTKRASLYLKLGTLSKAGADFSAALESKPGSTIATEGLEKVQQAETYFAQARKHLDNGKYEAARATWNLALEITPECYECLLSTAECSLRAGDYDAALEEGVRLSRVNSKSVDALWIRGQANFFSGDVAAAVETYKKALKLDPENKKIKSELKKAKKYSKALENGEAMYENRRWKEALTSYDEASSFYPDLPSSARLHEKRCHCNVELRKSDAAIRECKAALAIDEELYEANLFLGEAYLLKDELKQARQAFQAARTVNQHDGRAMQALQRLERLEKMAARKDYYKILGVTKEADGRTIKKAFHKLARDKHPDKFKGPEEEREAFSKAYQDINEAYEVLSNDEKRGKYDRGEDVEPNQGGGGGFRQGGFPGGFPGGNAGGGFQFFFH